MTEKNILRKKLKEKRKSIKNLDTEKKIIENLTGFLNEKNLKNILCYVSLEAEIGTEEILYNSDFNIAVPKVLGDYMEFYELSELEVGYFGVREPKGDVIVNKNDYDCCITPGLSFTKSGERIGYGKGYYDKYLMDFKNLKIGLCYDEMLSDFIPTEKNDIKMDVIITEKEVIILGEKI
ncbi:MAG: 5-formyltetrahydrofolate cyclo-ligase [Clostridia bacterium]|nr:5-formyltetrahydrofolate cyclo-ligase [Clostridia bacterium]